MKKIVCVVIVTVCVAGLAFALQQSVGTGDDDQPTKKGARPPSRTSVVDAALQRFVKMTPEQRWAHVQQLTPGMRQLIKVAKGDVTQTVVERGTLEPVVAAEIVSPAGDEKDVVRIKWVVKDGSLVKKGDKLVELDTVPLEEKIKELEIVVDEAKSELVKSEKERALIHAIHKSAKDVAKTRLEIAALCAKKYTGNDVTEKQLRKLNVQQAQHALELTELQALREKSQIELAYQKAKTEFALAKQHVQRHQRALSEYTIHSPIDGLALHYVPLQSRWGRGSSQFIVAEGEPVLRGQKLLRVTGTEQYLVTTRIHEAVVSQLRRGQTAQVRIDAFPKTGFTGRVKMIATVPWKSRFGADVIVYPMQVALTQKTPNLKPGMSAQVTIVAGERKNVLRLPVQAIAPLGRNTLCFVKTGRGLESRTIKLGLQGNAHVEIMAGLEQGEQVLLVPLSAAVRHSRFGRPGGTGRASKN